MLCHHMLGPLTLLASLFTDLSFRLLVCLLPVSKKPCLRLINRIFTECWMWVVLFMYFNGNGKIFCHTWFLIFFKWKLISDINGENEMFSLMNWRMCSYHISFVLQQIYFVPNYLLILLGVPWGAINSANESDIASRFLNMDWRIQHLFCSTIPMF